MTEWHSVIDLYDKLPPSSGSFFRRTGQKPRMKMRGTGGLFDFFNQEPNPKFYDPPQQAREPKPDNPTSGLSVPIH